MTNNSQLDPVVKLLEEALQRGLFTGVQVAVTCPARSLEIWLGHTHQTQLHGSTPITFDTRFDIASLTKALCTSLLAMQITAEQGFSWLDQSIRPFFPELPAADQISFRDLLSHRSGLAAHRPFFEILHQEEASSDPARARQRMRQLITAEPLAHQPRQTTLYSDLGYILLGWSIEEQLGAPLADLFSQRIASPLKLKSCFGPIPPPVAATERDELDQWLCGRVHDENARHLGGVAGHAGLFSNAHDLLTLIRHLDSVYRGRAGIVTSEVLREYWKPIPNSSFTLGWDTPGQNSLSGRHTTRNASVGHLGFTGCSLWHDLARNVSIVLLTNRVHPTRDHLGMQTFRPLFHDLVNRTVALT